MARVLFTRTTVAPAKELHFNDEEKVNQIIGCELA